MLTRFVYLLFAFSFTKPISDFHIQYETHNYNAKICETFVLTNRVNRGTIQDKHTCCSCHTGIVVFNSFIFWYFWTDSAIIINNKTQWIWWNNIHKHIILSHVHMTTHSVMNHIISVKYNNDNICSQNMGSQVRLINNKDQRLSLLSFIHCLNWSGHKYMCFLINLLLLEYFLSYF